MTEQEFIDAVAKLEQADTDIAALTVEHGKAIAAARVHNNKRKEIEAQRGQIEAEVAPLRLAVDQYRLEKKARDAAVAKVQAEENARKAAEAKAAEKSELEKLKEENAKLQEQLAAKG